MQRSPSTKDKLPLHKQRTHSLSQAAALRRRIALQKKQLLPLAGIGASRCSDISAAHDTYSELERWMRFSEMVEARSDASALLNRRLDAQVARYVRITSGMVLE